MKKLSMRKVSLLGMVLLAASAVTAAIVPSKAEPLDGNDDGSLRQRSNTAITGPLGILSCVTDLDGDLACTASTNDAVNTTGSTGIGEDDSFTEEGQTRGNTSQTTVEAGDQTSTVI